MSRTDFKPLYVSKSSSGNLLLHQRKMRHSPKHLKSKGWWHDSEPFIESDNLYQSGDIIRINDFATLSTIITDTTTSIPVCVVPYDEKSPNAVNKFYITRWKDGTLMLHTEKPVKVMETSDFLHICNRYKKVWKKITLNTGQFFYQHSYVRTSEKEHYCKKCATGWSVEHVYKVSDGKYFTRQHGHFRIHEFPGSESIKQSDTKPFEVMLKVI